MVKPENGKVYVYVITNDARTMLYSGVTGDIHVRLARHREDVNNRANSIPTRNGCCHLVYFEVFEDSNAAAQRQYQLSKMSKAAKDTMVSEFNPGWVFLNDGFQVGKTVSYSYKTVSKFVNRNV
jgi:putative endonuclease